MPQAAAAKGRDSKYVDTRLRQATEFRLAVGIEEAGRMLNVSGRTIIRKIETGEIKARKIGRRTVISIADLERYLESQ